MLEGRSCPTVQIKRSNSTKILFTEVKTNKRKEITCEKECNNKSILNLGNKSNNSTEKNREEKWRDCKMGGGMTLKHHPPQFLRPFFCSSIVASANLISDSEHDLPFLCYHKRVPTPWFFFPSQMSPCPLAASLIYHVRFLPVHFRSLCL